MPAPKPPPRLPRPASTPASDPLRHWPGNGPFRLPADPWAGPKGAGRRTEPEHDEDGPDRKRPLATASPWGDVAPSPGPAIVRNAARPRVTHTESTPPACPDASPRDGFSAPPSTIRAARPGHPRRPAAGFRRLDPGTRARHPVAPSHCRGRGNKPQSIKVLTPDERGRPGSLGAGGDAADDCAASDLTTMCCCVCKKGLVLTVANRSWTRHGC